MRKERNSKRRNGETTTNDAPHAISLAPNPGVGQASRLSSGTIEANDSPNRRNARPTSTSLAPSVEESRGKRATQEMPDSCGKGNSARAAEPPARAADSWNLSPRQTEILACIVRGLSDKQIAAELRLSNHTIGSYLKILFRRLGVHSRAELMALCHQSQARKASHPPRAYP